MKKILTAILLSVYVFVSCVLSFSVYATNEEISIETISEEITADSSASITSDLNNDTMTESDTNFNLTDEYVQYPEFTDDSENVNLSPQESFMLHKNDFLLNTKYVLNKINENVLNKEYTNSEIKIGASNPMYFGASCDYTDIDEFIDEELCNDICLFADGLYELIGKHVVHEYVTKEEKQEILEITIENNNNQKIDNLNKAGLVFSIYLYNNLGDESAKYVSIRMTGNYLRTPWGYFYLDDTDEIVKYVADDFFGEKETNLAHKLTGEFYDPTYSENLKHKLDYENKQYGNSEIDIIDKLTFDIRLSEEHKRSFFYHLSEPGTIVNCQIVQISGISIGSNLNKFVLTAKGSKCTMEFDSEAPNGWGYSGTYNYIDFGPMRILGTSDENDVVSVNVAVRYLFSDDLQFPSVPTENMKYEFYYEGNTLAERRAMYKLFGISKDNIIVPLKEEQDPEYYITKMKNSYELFGEQFVTDYKINFIAVMPIDVSAKAAPDWYAKLGDDVKATILGISSTLNGEERNCYTMVKFEGSKNHIWFDMLSGSHKINWSKTDYTADDVLEMTLEYDSLLSFDGEEKIQNTLDKEYFDARMYFSHEDFSIKSIEFDIGLATDTVTSDEINYIGGGKAVYEKIM